MATTTAQAILLERTAAEFEQVHDELAGMLARLRADLESLDTHWQGAGGRSLAQARQAWADDQRALQRALAETAEALRAAGTRYAAADTAVGARLGRVGRDMELPQRSTGDG